MKLVFSEQAWEDYLYWQKIDKKLVQRINDLIKEITGRRTRAQGSLNRSSTPYQVIGRAVSTKNTASFTKWSMIQCLSLSCDITTEGT